MSKFFKFVMAGLVAGTFLLEAPPAHAIFGIRIARTAIAARRAQKELSSSEAKTTTPGEEDRTRENLERLERNSGNVNSEGSRL